MKQESPNVFICPNKEDHIIKDEMHFNVTKLLKDVKKEMEEKESSNKPLSKTKKERKRKKVKEASKNT